MKNELKAALIFSDREFSEMLRYELKSCGYKVANNENEADIILTEEEMLPYINNEKIVIVFMRYGFENHEKDGNILVFPYVFSTSFLRKELKNLFAELLRASADDAGSPTGDNVEILPLPDKKSALVGERTVSLSKTEWKMLSLLTIAAKNGKAVSRKELEETMGYESEKGGNIVDVYICRLRKKIENPLGRKLIYTVRGSGYSLMKG